MTDTRSITVKGRDIKVVQPTDVQFMLMGREAQRVQRALRNDTISKEQVPGLLSSMATVLDILETRVVDEGDREYLIDLMKAGELGLNELTPIINAFAAEEDDTPKKPVARRGRTSRTR
jgi:hypothetical protein